MDRKSIFVLVVSFMLLLLWYPLTNKLFPPEPLPPSDSIATGTNGPATLGPIPGAGPGSPGEVASPSSGVLPPEFTQTPAIVMPTGPEETLTIETELARYTVTSHGGGLKSIELKKYEETVGRQARRGHHQGDLVALNDGAPLPIFTVIGVESAGDNGSYELRELGGGVRAEKTLSSGLRIIKEFRPGTNYLLTAAVRFENTSTQDLRLPAQEWVVGTATPISPYDEGMLTRMQWFDGRSASQVNQSWFQNKTLGCFPGTPRSTYTAGNTNVVWGSAQNQFFALITITPTNQAAARVVARHIDLPAPTPDALQADRQLVAKPFGIQTAFVYPDQVLRPGEFADRRFELFAGPKEYRTLDRLGTAMGSRMDLVMDFGGFWGFFPKLLLLSMNAVHGLGLSYGLSIVVITIIIKLLFWPLTQASTRSMKRMQKLQPQMKELQEKYKDDRKKMNERLMKFMKEHRINPAAGCLPIVVQIPVFIGFYKMLQSAIELRGARFLWAFDLSQPDTIWVIPGLGFPLNPLPIIMGVTQFWQMRMTPASPGMDPVQQKMFQYMPLIFLFILYNFSSGLTLYWTVQNLLTIAQMKLTKSTGEKDKEKEKEKESSPPGPAPKRGKAPEPPRGKTA